MRNFVKSFGVFKTCLTTLFNVLLLFEYSARMSEC